MPLVVIAGLPCSGKTRIAQQLEAVFRERGLEVVIVDEPSLHLERNQSYKDVPSEKNTRGLLKAALERSLGRRRVVLFDSLNAIKGFRFEIYCLARQAAARYCVLHVDTPAETCSRWNAERPEQERYSEAVFEDLAGRFERPDSRNRWERPLFALRPALGEELLARAVAEVAAGMDPAGGGGRGLGSAAPPPDAVLEARAVKQLMPNLSTHLNCAVLSATNLQYEIDRAAQAVVERIAEAQAAAGACPPSVVAFSASGSTSSGTEERHGGGDAVAATALQLDVSRPMLLPELRRHKRTFMKLTTNQTWVRVPDAAAAQRLFVNYLRQQLVAQQ